MGTEEELGRTPAKAVGIRCSVGVRPVTRSYFGGKPCTRHASSGCDALPTNTLPCWSYVVPSQLVLLCRAPQVLAIFMKMREDKRLKFHL